MWKKIEAHQLLICLNATFIKQDGFMDTQEPSALSPDFNETSEYKIIKVISKIDSLKEGMNQ